MFAAHSGIRFLVLLVGLAVVVYAAYGLIAKREYTPAMARLAGGFTGLIDLNILLGVATLFSRPFTGQLIGHLMMMVFAAVVAHGTGMVMKRRPPEAKTYGPHLVGAALALVLIAGGIMAIGRGVFQSTV